MYTFIIYIGIAIIITFIILMIWKKIYNTSTENTDDDLREEDEELNVVSENSDDIFYENLDKGKKSKFLIKIKYVCLEEIKQLLFHSGIPHLITINKKYYMVNNLDEENSYAIVEVIDEYYNEALMCVNNFINEQDKFDKKYFNFNMEN